jgi:hypothetical protein
MGAGSTINEIVRPTDRLVMVVGSYGSGKTEVSVNLAVAVAASGRKVQIADLDIVNPYFRCREARLLMEQYDIRVVVPPGKQEYADLPIVLPEIAGMLQPPEGVLSLFDVGGDEVGARVLASLRPRILDGQYELWQVINSRRPFTGTVDGCLNMLRELEMASRLRVTGLLVNSHLIEQTTLEVVLEGWNLAREVAEKSGLPLRCVAAMEPLADAPEIAGIDVPLLRLRRHMLPPWLKPEAGDAPSPGEPETLPAGRPTPIGTPPKLRLVEPGGGKNG